MPPEGTHPSQHRFRTRLITLFSRAHTAWRLEWAVELCDSGAEDATVLKRWIVETQHDLLGGCRVERVLSHYWSEQVKGYKQVELRRAKTGAFGNAANQACKNYQILFKGLGAHLKERKR